MSDTSPNGSSDLQQSLASSPNQPPSSLQKSPSSPARSASSSLVKSTPSMAHRSAATSVVGTSQHSFAASFGNPSLSGHKVQLSTIADAYGEDPDRLADLLTGALQDENMNPQIIAKGGTHTKVPLVPENPDDDYQNSPIVSSPGSQIRHESAESFRTTVTSPRSRTPSRTTSARHVKTRDLPGTEMSDTMSNFTMCSSITVVDDRAPDSQSLPDTNSTRKPRRAHFFEGDPKVVTYKVDDELVLGVSARNQWIGLVLFIVIIICDLAADIHLLSLVAEHQGDPTARYLHFHTWASFAELVVLALAALLGMILACTSHTGIESSRSRFTRSKTGILYMGLLGISYACATALVLGSVAHQGTEQYAAPLVLHAFWITAFRRVFSFDNQVYRAEVVAVCVLVAGIFFYCIPPNLHVIPNLLQLTASLCLAIAFILMAETQKRCNALVVLIFIALFQFGACLGIDAAYNGTLLELFGFMNDSQAWFFILLAVEQIVMLLAMLYSTTLLDTLALSAAFTVKTIAVPIAGHLLSQQHPNWPNIEFVRATVGPWWFWLGLAISVVGVCAVLSFAFERKRFVAYTLWKAEKLFKTAPGHKKVAEGTSEYGIAIPGSGCTGDPEKPGDRLPKQQGKPDLGRTSTASAFQENESLIGRTTTVTVTQEDSPPSNPEREEEECAGPLLIDPKASQ